MANRPDPVANGARAYPGQDTDRPKMKRPKECEVYALNWNSLLPYGHVRENGQMIRVQTDGNGGLIEFVESSTARLIYGETRGTWRKVREAAPRNPPISNGNLKRVALRYGKEARILAYLHKHQQGGNGARFSTIADVAETSVKAASLMMYRLRDQGYVTVYYGREGPRRIAHWQATNLWHQHLPRVVKRIIITKPMSATHTAQLLNLEYGCVVKALAELAADGLLDRKRVGPGYVYMEHADLEIGGW